ncbi:hypothetical protein Poli38472_008376 [Pythium oligandrum]|uniref:Fibronectin type-III domain-containing protein n=1 Tax=Pythium oligandrum TaxID=41045 RepID=A0A8K1CMD1_PYTOL|nr:hypothetical protein Poli38472_008376 [Pythium oligandrum]|eukprot:TMW65734.1 hypothetical protein Poli38472_008376 [Pythium oligandrum]
MARRVGLVLALLACLSDVNKANAIRKSSSFVTPTYGTADSLTLTTLVTDAADLHYAAVQAGSAPLDASAIKNAAQRCQSVTREVVCSPPENEEDPLIVRAETIALQKAQKVERLLDGLAPNSTYDVYFVAEVPNSNGVYGTVLSVLGTTTHPAPPEMVNVAAVATNASAHAMEVSMSLSAPGVAHMAFIPSEQAPERFVLDDVVNHRALGTNAVFVSEARLSWDSLEFQFVREGLTSATEYDLLLVTEALGQGGVFSKLHRMARVARTHAQAPDLTSLRCLACDGSASELTVTFTLGFDAQDLMRASPQALPYFSYHLHYEAEAVTDVIGENAEGTAKDSVSGVFVIGNVSSVEELHGLSRQTQTRIIGGLASGTSCQLSIVAETVDSFGVSGRRATVSTCETHHKAPKIVSAQIEPTNATVNALTVTVELERPGDVHYLAGNRMLHSIRNSFHHATSISHLRELIRERERRDDVELLTGVVRGIGFGADADQGNRGTFTVDGLADATAYSIVLLPETTNSHGVLGRPHEELLEATTNENASTVEIVEVTPVSGSLSAVQVHVDMSKPNDLLYYCVDPPVQTTNDEQIADPCTELETASRERTSGNNFMFVVGSLAEDTIYNIQLFAASARRNGVVSLKTQPQVVRTHRRAAGILSVQAKPVPARTDGIALSVQVDEPCLVHYAIEQAQLDGKEEAHEPLTADIVVEQTPPQQQQHHHHRHHHHHHHATVNDGSRKIVRRGNIYAAVHALDLLLDGLSPNATYNVHVVTESTRHETQARSGVYSSIVSSNTTTHAIAPVIVKATADAAAGTIDSIVLTANLSAPGYVHYHLSDVDFADPSIIRGDRNEPNGVVTPHIVRGVFMVEASDIVMEVINGTNDTKPMEPLVYARNLTIHGLRDGTTYHVSLTTETLDSQGVFGEFPPPILVITHAQPPQFEPPTFHVGPVPGSSTSLVIQFHLSELGEVHYALFFRGLIDDRSDRNQEVAVEEGVDDNNETTPRWPPVSSSYNITQLTASMLKAATVDDLGEGVWENGTISVSRDDVLRHKLTEKKIEKLPPNAVFDVCLVAETAASDGIFQWVDGKHACHRVVTHADYSNQSILMDEVEVMPVDGRSDAIRIEMAMSKLLSAPTSTQANMESNPIDWITDMTGRVPYFVLIDGKEGRSDFFHNSFAESKHQRDLAVFKDAVPGRGHVAAAGILSHVTGENETMITLTHMIDGLDANHRYFFFFAYETVGSDGVFTKVNPHKYRSNDSKSENEGIEVTTHEHAPKLTRYAAYPTYGNTTRISVKFGVSCSSCTQAIAHLLAYESGCPPPTMEILKTRPTVEPDEEPIAYSDHKAPCQEPVALRRVVVDMAERQTSRNDIEEDFDDVFRPNSTYDVYLATETADSNGVFSNSFIHTAATTFAPAPDFTYLSIKPRKGSTTELLLEFELARPGEIHYMLGKSENAEFNATSPYNISSKSLPTEKHHHRAPHFHNYDREVVRMRRSVKVARAHERHVEVLDYLTPGTPYDFYAVAESIEDKGIYGDIKYVKEVTTFNNAPIILVHSAYPTAGSTSSLTVGFRVDGPCLVHAAVITSTLWAETTHVANGSDIYGNRLAMHDQLVQQKTMTIEESSLEEIGGVVDSGWRELNIAVPRAGTNYTVHLVTETIGSDGVFGTVATHYSVNSHAEPPTLHNVSVSPSDARVDALTVSATLTSFGHVHFAALRRGERFQSASPAASGAISVNTTADEIVSFVIDGLRERTTYDVYLRTETLNSGGVFGEWTEHPIFARTHGLPAQVLEDLECNVLPSCETMGRETCTRVPNMCGECLDGFSGADGPSNEPCRAISSEPNDDKRRSGRPTIKISGVRINPRRQKHSSPPMEAMELPQETVVESPPEPIEESATSTPDDDSTGAAACPFHAQLVAPGQCECEDGYEPDHTGTACVLASMSMLDAMTSPFHPSRQS